MRAVLVAFLVLLAPGCILLDGSGAPESAVTGPTAPRAFSLRLDDTGALIEGEAAQAIRPLNWGWLQWFDGVEGPAWTSAPADSPYVVTAATAHVIYTAMHPVTSPQQRPEFTVWWGVEDSVVDHGFADGPATLTPADRIEAVFELALPMGGLVVEKGQRLVLRVGSYYNDDARQGGVAIVMGETRVDIETRPVQLAPLQRGDVLDIPVALTGGRCMGFDPVSSQDLEWIPLALTQGTRGLDVIVDHQGGDGPPDVDFVILDANGDTVAHASGSAGHEAIRLRGPNFDAVPPGEWQLGVYACTLQRSSVAVSIITYVE